MIMSASSPTALIVIVPGLGSLTSWTTPTPEDRAAAYAASNLGLLVVERVCAPGQVAVGTGSSDNFNPSCGEDL